MVGEERGGIVKILASPLVHALFVILVGILAYSNTFTPHFVFDDDAVIVQNPLVRSVSNIPAFFAAGVGVAASRPLMHATFALNYHFGGLDPTGYHAVNLALHLTNGALVYFLVLMTGRLLKYDYALARLAALLASLLFVLHPIQTDAVNNVVSRSMLLATTFYISGIMLFVGAVTQRRKKWPYVMGLFAVSILGAASREDFATFPAMLFLYDLFFISGFRAKEVMKHWKAYIPVAAAFVYLLYLVLNNNYDRTEGSLGSGLAPLEFALTHFKVHWTYLRLLAFPVNQSLDYDFSTSRTLLEPPTLLSFLGYLGLWTGAILIARKSRTAAFGVLWFLVTLLPASFMLALAGAVLGTRLDDVIFEHRLYLSSAGFISELSLLAVSYFSRLKTARAQSAVACCVVLALISLSTALYKRNIVWQSGISLWSDVIKKFPNNARAHNNLASLYASAGRAEEAREHLQIAVGLRPDLPGAHYNLGVAYASEGQYDRAIEQYRIALIYNPDNAKAHSNLGSAYFFKGRLQDAIRHSRIALSLDPDLAEAHVNLGAAYGAMNRFEEAIEHLRIAVEMRPDSMLAHRNLAVAYSKVGLKDEAEEHYRIAKTLSEGGGRLPE